jgi:hypothetical protein
MFITAKEAWMGAFGKSMRFALGAVLLATIGCGSSDNGGNHEIWFMGAIIDGATGKPITADIVPDVKITLVYGQTKKDGKVDGTTGRFTLGPLKAWNDYGILIDAGPSYRRHLPLPRSPRTFTRRTRRKRSTSTGICSPAQSPPPPSASR